MSHLLHLIAPSAPPKVCGVGDHSHLLGEQLARRTALRIHCGQSDPAPRFGDLDARVDFDHRFPWTLVRLAGSDGFRPGSTIFFQYTNFAYGRWGFNPWLAPALRRWKRRGLRVATMFHENYMPPVGIKIRLMGFWQRQFFRQVGLASDLCLFSVEPWTRRYASWFPHARVATLPVGSNIPRIAVDRAARRRELGIPAETPVLGVFGGPHPSRLVDWVAGATRHLRERGIEHRILRIGPGADEMARILDGAPLQDLGILEADEASRALSCVDVFLSPISDGASSRRGSLLAGLAHGLPCISTLGHASDDIFRQAAGTALEIATGPEDFARICLELCLSPERRSALGRAGAEFHDRHFGWEGIADRFLSLAEIVPDRG